RITSLRFQQPPAPDESRVNAHETTYSTSRTTRPSATASSGRSTFTSRAAAS
ncbi:unnamed protein product, partial [Amoebophrya sp. A25]